jgi:hypothetical protein
MKIDAQELHLASANRKHQLTGNRFDSFIDRNRPSRTAGIDPKLSFANDCSSVWQFKAAC